MRGQIKAGVPKRKKIDLKQMLKSNWQLYVLVLPAVIYFFVFNYMPLYGIQIAFKDYKAVSGIMGSQWVGLKHFETFGFVGSYLGIYASSGYQRASDNIADFDWFRYEIIEN